MMKKLLLGQLLAEAQRISGIALDDTEAQEPLGILVDSLNNEAQLSADGVAAMEQRLLRLLINRLRMARDMLAHPEIQEINIAAPVFIFGLPRSGTTKLQKLLSATADFTALPLWMAHNPSLISGDRHEDPAQRIADTQQYVDWTDRVSPTVRLVHPFETFEPEEVNPILEQGFLSSYLPAFVEATSYIQWCVAQDPKRQLIYLRRVLQYLQWQFPKDNGKPWVLKNPTFLGMEPALQEVFPDARLIMTHRHPEKVIASTVSLIIGFHKLYSDIDVSKTAGNAMLEGQAYVMQMHLDNRAIASRLDIIDVGYGELTSDGAGTVEKIYGRLGLEFTPATRTSIGQWEQEHRQHRFGQHLYRLADFGLTLPQVEEKFARYIAECGGYF